MVLSLNLGTSSLKIAAYDHELTLQEMAHESYDVDADSFSTLDQIIHELFVKIQRPTSDIKLFGMRIVHGGEKYTDATLITPEVYSYLESIQDLAPLHNPPALRLIKKIQSLFPSIPVIAVFDTGFHKTMPEVAKRYALPEEIEKLHVRRYGFHGLAHKSMRDMYCYTTGTDVQHATIITCQLGSGCSLCAIKNGNSIDTTMGFSPLEGLVSRTRTGDIDASVPLYIAGKTGKSMDEVMHILNRDSGLVGLSKTDGDIRHILEKIQQDDSSAQFAMKSFIYRIQKYLGAYITILDGADAIIFGGGISEHNFDVVAGICTGVHLNTSLELKEQITFTPPMIRISTDSSPRAVYIASVNEEKEIADEALSALTNISN